MIAGDWGGSSLRGVTLDNAVAGARDYGKREVRPRLEQHPVWGRSMGRQQ